MSSKGNYVAFAFLIASLLILVTVSGFWIVNFSYEHSGPLPVENLAATITLQPRKKIASGTTNGENTWGSPVTQSSPATPASNGSSTRIVTQDDVIENIQFTVDNERAAGMENALSDGFDNLKLKVMLSLTGENAEVWAGENVLIGLVSGGSENGVATGFADNNGSGFAPNLSLDGVVRIKYDAASNVTENIKIPIEIRAKESGVKGPGDWQKLDFYSWIAPVEVS